MDLIEDLNMSAELRVVTLKDLEEMREINLKREENVQVGFRLE